MAQDDAPLVGEVEMDETTVDGKPRRGYLRPETDRTAFRSHAARSPSSATVVAAIERGGRIKATVLPSRRAGLKEQAQRWIVPDAVVYTGRVSTGRLSTA